MNHRTILALACLLTFSTAPVLAQHDADDNSLTVQHVSGNIYMLVGEGGNIGVTVGEDGILIVDDKFARLADDIRAALQQAGGGELKFILNTHWHGDHTGANRVFGPETTIIAHTNVRKRLSTEQRSGERVTPPQPKEAWPVITFDQSLSVHFNGEEIKVIHLPPGHTDGDSVILFTKSNVVHMGDDFFSGTFPFVDLDSGGSVQGLIDSVGKILGSIPADAKIIPGHGPLSTLDDLKAYHRMLVETTRLVREKMEAGKTLEQIKADGLGEWESWSWQFISTDSWIETIYRSFSP